MARQLSPRLSPKVVGPRVPVENLVTKKPAESNLLVNSIRANVTAQVRRYYSRHDGEIRGEPEKEQFNETRICPVLDCDGLNTYK